VKEKTMPPKMIGLIMSIIGSILIVISVASLSLPEIRQWFPVLLLGGGYLVWVGLGKYRAV
jgi:hypothetical protein